MARSSSSTRSQRTTMSKPSERSRAELPRQNPRATDYVDVVRDNRGPKDKKHKSLAEVQQTGWQSQQGDRPGAGKRKSSRGK